MFYLSSVNEIFLFSFLLFIFILKSIILHYRSVFNLDWIFSFLLDTAIDVLNEMPFEFEKSLEISKLFFNWSNGY
jgi:hypothetical protein